MFQLPTQVQLTDCRSGAKERATIVDLDRETAKIRVDAEWWLDLSQLLSQPDDEPDRHWRWRELISICQNKTRYKAVCVRTMDGIVQGAMLLQAGLRSAMEPGEKAVFVDRLATAPWNRTNLVLQPHFRGSGSALILFAVAYSRSLGYAGRVNLCVTASEVFYLSRGFVPTSIRYLDETVFELPFGVAEAMLIQEGLIDD